MKLKISEIQAAKINLQLTKLYVNYGHIFVKLNYTFHIQCQFIEIDDFGVIFWQKLTNSDGVICTICEGHIVVLASSSGITEKIRPNWVLVMTLKWRGPTQYLAHYT